MRRDQITSTTIKRENRCGTRESTVSTMREYTLKLCRLYLYTETINFHLTFACLQIVNIYVRKLMKYI